MVLGACVLSWACRESPQVHQVRALEGKLSV